MRIAWFSKSNQDEVSSSVAAYCSDLLLPALRKHHEVVHFHDSQHLSNFSDSAHYLCALDRHRQSPFDIFFYQIEDAKTGDLSRLHCGLMPGLTWFHDVYLSSHGPEPILNSPWSNNLLRSRDGLAPWQDRSHSYFREGPIAQREIAMSAGLLASCPRLATEINSWSGERLMEGSRATYLPHPVKVTQILPAKVGKIVFSGSPRIEHRAYKLLCALEQISSDWREFVWLLDRSEFRAARAILEEVGLPPEKVELTGDRSPDRWREVVSDAEVAIHPLVSAYGQLGPYLNISLMSGVPVITSDFAAGSLLPKQIVLQVNPGEEEEAQIREAIRTLLSGNSREVGAAGRQFAEEFFEQSIVARELEILLSDLSHQSHLAIKQWENLRALGRKRVFDGVFPDLGLGSEFFRERIIGAISDLGWRL